MGDAFLMPDKQQYIVERFTDGGYVVLEHVRGSFEAPSAWIPPDAREGDVLTCEIERDGAESRLRLVIDPEAAQERRSKLSEKRARLKRGPKGDVNL